MALMGNPAPWETQSPWGEESNHHHHQRLPDSTELSQDLTMMTTSTPTISAPLAFSSLSNHPELILGKGQTAPRRTSHAEKLPVEILCFIFEILAARRGAAELKNCASTCRLWANVALPVLYRYCGFGVFEYIPPQPYRKQNSHAAVPYSDSPFLQGRSLVASPKLVLRQACYWRTLLLSCFWKDDLGERNATSYPYLHYVENLDLLVLALVVNRCHAHRYRIIKNALFGVGTKWEGFMAQHFGSTQDVGFGVLSRILNILLPQIKHVKSVKSVNVFIEDDVTGNHACPDKIFARTIVQPVLETIAMFSRIVNLEISGQENLTPAFGRAIKALRPSLISPDNKTINKIHTFSLRITGARRVWAGLPDPIEEFHRNKGFLDALNENSVTLVDFDLTDDWEWNLDHISEFLIRQARTLKAIRLRGLGDTVDTWQLLDRMGRRGCRVRGLDLENRHVHHPPVIFDPTAWAFKSGLLKKLKYLAVDNFQGITNSVTNYHMIDPTSFSIVLKHNLFGGRSTGNRLTPPIKTLVLTRTTTGSKVPEQIGAFVMHLAPTLTTLEIGYLSNGDNTDDFTSIAHCREQGRYKLIEVLVKLSQLKRLKAVGYAAEILLCSCITPVAEEDDTADQDTIMDVSRPRSPARPSTPVGYNLHADAGDMGPSRLHNSPAQPTTPQYEPVTGMRLPSSHRPVSNPPAFQLFTNTWKSSLEELELMPSGQIIFTVHGGLVDDTLWFFTQLQKLRVFTLLFGGEDSGTRYDEPGVGMPQSLRQLHFEQPTGGGEIISESESEAGRSRQSYIPGKITPDGLLRFVNALPRMALIRERVVMQKFWVGKRYMDPTHIGIGSTGVEKKEKWPRWAVRIAEMMKSRGMDFVLA